MIAVDTNVLVYAHKRQAPLHAAAADVVRQLAESPTAWAIPWPCLHEFYAVVTHPRVFSPPSTPKQATRQLEQWCASPSVRLLSESADHLARLAPLCQRSAITGSRVHDAKIAAICMAHGVREIVTMDRDFSRFPELTTRSLVADD